MGHFLTNPYLSNKLIQNLFQKKKASLHKQNVCNETSILRGFKIQLWFNSHEGVFTSYDPISPFQPLKHQL